MEELVDYDGVLVLHIDRLRRSVMDLNAKVRTIADKELFFEAIDQSLRISNDRRDPVSHLMLAMLSGVAEFEHELISDRVQDGIERARRQGKRIGRTPLMEKRDVESSRIFEVSREGKSIGEIAQIVGIGRGTVRRILILLSRNPPV